MEWLEILKVSFEAVTAAYPIYLRGPKRRGKEDLNAMVHLVSDRSVRGRDRGPFSRPSSPLQEGSRGKGSLAYVGGRVGGRMDHEKFGASEHQEEYDFEEVGM